MDNYNNIKNEFIEDMTSKENSGVLNLDEEQAQKYSLLHFALGLRCKDQLGEDLAARVQDQMDTDFALHKLKKWEEHLEVEATLGHMMTIWPEHGDTVSFIQNHIDYMKYLWMKFYPNTVTNHAIGKERS